MPPRTCPTATNTHVTYRHSNRIGKLIRHSNRIGNLKRRSSASTYMSDCHQYTCYFIYSKHILYMGTYHIHKYTHTYTYYTFYTYHVQCLHVHVRLPPMHISDIGGGRHCHSNRTGNLICHSNGKGNHQKEVQCLHVHVRLPPIHMLHIVMVIE